MFTRIPGNLLEDSRECCYFIIRGNDEEDSGECSRRFRGMFPKILGNDRKDSGECSKRFRGMFKKIPGNVRGDYRESKFRFILWNLAYFLSNSAIKPRKNAFVAYRHFTQNQFQKFNARPLYIYLWKLQNTEYKTYTIFKINKEKQPLELFCTKRCSSRFCKFHRKTPTLETPWRSGLCALVGYFSIK